MNTQLLKKLYHVHAPSQQEEPMRVFIKQYVSDICPDAVVNEDDAGNIYITQGNDATYPCVVAHMDQVQRFHPDDFTIIRSHGAIFGYSPSHRSFCGLGADDKNGIFVALECLRFYPVMKCAFFVSEEIGCIGSKRADMSFFADCRFVLQPDRRGSSDIITSIAATKLCSKEFLEDAAPDMFLYKPTNGAMTDVLTLKQRGLNVSCVNLSCGYYDPHTNKEHTNTGDLLQCLALVRHIIETCTKVYTHTAATIRHAHQKHKSKWYDKYDIYSYYDDDYYGYRYRRWDDDSDTIAWNASFGITDNENNA